MHTLVLLGELDYASAPTLEAEIERVCETGVDGITLDLSQLTYIDATGVAVIAFRCRLCQRRGYEFAVIPGRGAVRAAFERAGVSEALTLAQRERGVEVARVAAAPTSQASRSASVVRSTSSFSRRRALARDVSGSAGA